MNRSQLPDALSELAARIRAGGGPCPLCADRGLGRVVYAQPDLDIDRPRRAPIPDRCPACARETTTIVVRYVADWRGQVTA